MKNLSQKKGKPKKGQKRRRSYDRDPSVSIKIIGASGQPETIRVRLPKQGEVLGIVTQILGADRLQVRCTDGHTRVVVIPGKFRKRLWTRQNDIVSVMPWYDFETQVNTRAYLCYRYNRNQADWLEKKGYIKLD